MNTPRYSEPVQKLLQLGMQEGAAWPDYPAMGLTPEHIPELIELVADEALRWEDDGAWEIDEADLDQSWAQIHAWRALGQLKAEEAIPALLGILHQVDDYDDEWAGEELMEVFALIGPAAIQPLTAYLLDPGNKPYARGVSGESLKEMAEAYPETRDECVAGLAAALQLYEHNDETLNAFIIYDLVDLKAVEHLGLIEEAFTNDRVDQLVMGDFEDVQIELGLLIERTTPRPPNPYLRDWLTLKEQELKRSQQSSSRQAEKKAKSKRKQAEKSRKANRKKKR
jgi:HEAT repeat protein